MNFCMPACAVCLYICISVCLLYLDISDVFLCVCVSMLIYLCYLPLNSMISSLSCLESCH
jgi:hypothetical protein